MQKAGNPNGFSAFLIMKTVALFVKAREKLLSPQRNGVYFSMKKSTKMLLCPNRDGVALPRDQEDGSGWRSHL